MQLAPQVPVETNVTSYPLAEANIAFNDLRAGNFEVSAVLDISPINRRVLMPFGLWYKVLIFVSLAAIHRTNFNTDY